MCILYYVLKRGGAVELLTNVIFGITTNPVDIPFALINMTIGIIVGLVGAFGVITKMIIERGAGIVQLPCPETLFLGLKRPPMSKEEYPAPEYIISLLKLTFQICMEKVLTQQKAFMIN